MVISLSAKLGEPEQIEQGQAVKRRRSENDISMGVICAKSDDKRQGIVRQAIRSFSGASTKTSVAYVSATAFCEPLAAIHNDPPAMAVVRWASNLGPMGNWLSALMSLYAEDPKAKFYAIVEDDVVLCDGLADYIMETVDHRQAVVLSPYTAAVAQVTEHPETWCWHRSPAPQSLSGSLCLVLTNRAARLLLHSAEIIDCLRADSPARIDERVGLFCKSTGVELWQHFPSLAQHVGDGSAADDAANRRAGDYPGAAAIQKKLDAGFKVKRAISNGHRPENGRAMTFEPMLEGVAESEAESDVVTRHLIYHLFVGDGDWRWHVEWLKAHCELFNGRVLVSLAAVQHTAVVEAAALSLSEAGCEVRVVDNDPEFWERGTFVRQVLDIAAEIDQNPGPLPNIVYRLHSKSVTNATAMTVAWRDRAFRELINNRNAIEAEMIGKGIYAAGPFKRGGEYAEISGVKWHFSGAMYAISGDMLASAYRSGALLTTLANGMKLGRFLPEAFPGLMIHGDRARNIGIDVDAIAPKRSLYEKPTREAIAAAERKEPVAVEAPQIIGKPQGDGADRFKHGRFTGSVPGDRERCAVIITMDPTSSMRLASAAVGSAMQQTVRPAAVFVVSDGYHDGVKSLGDMLQAAADATGTNGITVKGACTSGGGVHLSRNAGVDMAVKAGCRYAICLDYDDVLAPNYIAACLEKFQQAERKPAEFGGAVGIVYADFVWFSEDESHRDVRGKNGERGSLRSGPNGVANIDTISGRNFIHTSAMFRVDCWRTAWPERKEARPADSCAMLNDWWMWRRIMSQGVKAAHTPETVLYYRMRADSQSATINQRYAKDPEGRYYSGIEGDLEPVHIVLPLSGREQYFSDQWAALTKEMNDASNARRQFHITAVISGSLSGFAGMVETAIGYYARNVRGGVSFEIVIVPEIDGRVANLDRRIPENYQWVQRNMIKLWAQIKPRLQHEFVFVLEDDLLPDQTGFISRLMKGFDEDTACVGGVYRSRYTESYVLWQEGRSPSSVRKNGGVEDIGGTGWGCIMLRRSAINATVFSFEGCGNFDITFAEDMRQLGKRVRVCWDVTCNHAGLPVGNPGEDIAKVQS